MASEEILRAAAEILKQACDDPWAEKDVAGFVVAAVEPLIREQIAKEIEATIPDWDSSTWDYPYDEGKTAGKYEAAQIARGEHHE